MRTMRTKRFLSLLCIAAVLFSTLSTAMALSIDQGYSCYYLDEAKLSSVLECNTWDGDSFEVYRSNGEKKTDYVAFNAYFARPNSTISFKPDVTLYACDIRVENGVIVIHETDRQVTIPADSTAADVLSTTGVCFNDTGMWSSYLALDTFLEGIFSSDSSESADTAEPGMSGDSAQPMDYAETAAERDPSAVAYRSSNCNAQQYSRWSSPVRSYLYNRKDGGVTRVEGGSGGVAVEVYDSEYQLLTSRTIANELPIFGGFYSGAQYNFLVFGQENRDESDAAEVIRVVMYDKDWNRLGQTSLNGGNTYSPFEAGSLRFAENDGRLYIRTCHKMYQSSDGLRHQANVTMIVRESDMTMTDAFYDVWNVDRGYVSHSFNQFILTAKDGSLVTLDHGDAYPRAAVVCRYLKGAQSEKLPAAVTHAELVHFSGNVGDNSTGATVGGFEESASAYLAAMVVDPRGAAASYKDPKNVSVYAIDKSLSGEPTCVQLTDYTGTVSASTPQTVRLSDDRFLVLWNIMKQDSYGSFSLSDTFGYVTVDEYGKPVGSVQTAQGNISDCKPIVRDGAAVWYVTKNSEPVFYVLDGNGVRKYDVALQMQDVSIFTDVPSDAYYTSAIQWALKRGVTNGTSETTFSPDATVTREQAVTFLWRAMGEPEPGSALNPFTDISSSGFAYKAVLWAVEDGITNGTSATTYSPKANVTRGQMITFLWRTMGRPGGEAADEAWYAAPERWANGRGLLDGTALAYQTDAVCPRSDVVTYLFRALNPGTGG